MTFCRTAALDIQVAEDVFERTGSDEDKTLVNNLCATWLTNTPPPWDWDGWNDDIGWFTLALIRGYQITGTQNFLDQAKYGFNYAFGRGWNTTYNNGGIWEENPEYITGAPHKEALSTDSLGKVACYIYQSTQDENYKERCTEIYDWTRATLFNTSTGALYAGIDESGTVNTATEAYNQGTFIDFANLVYSIRGDQQTYNDAKLALDFGRNSLTDSNGIFSNPSTSLNTWADEFARGAGHFVAQNNLWDEYYDWFVDNANAILANRRSDIGVTWNGWDSPTPLDNTLVANEFMSAVAWLQYTPATKPTSSNASTKARRSYH